MDANSTFEVKTLGFIGTGNMGMGMVTRWRSLGGSAEICDIDPVRQAQGRQLGATLHGSPADVAQALPDHGLLIVSVVTAEQTREVLWGAAGAAPYLRPTHTVMLCPTIAPEDTVSIANQLSAAGVACIDAPMSGGPQRAALGTMSLMVATSTDCLQRHEAVLKSLANPVFHVSERVGDGAKTKLVNNLLAGIQLIGAAEVLVLAEQMGLNLSTTLSVIEQSSGQSWIGSNRMHRALSAPLDVQAHVSLLAKDTTLAMTAAEQHGLVPELGQVATKAFSAAIAAGWAERDDSAMLDWLRHQNGR